MTRCLVISGYRNHSGSLFPLRKLISSPQVRAKAPDPETRWRTMKRNACVLLLGLVTVACSIPGRPVGEAQPPPTKTASAEAPTATVTPATPTPVPQTSTPLPPVITADTVGDLSVAFSFAEGIVRSLDRK